jgi:hypothetical protein
VAASQLGEPGVTEAQMFGAPGLKTGGKFFVTLFRGVLAVKLPKERVDELVASGGGAPFEPMEGRAMKEWLALAPEAGVERWKALAAEARAFVAGSG